MLKLLSPVEYQSYLVEYAQCLKTFEGQDNGHSLHTATNVHYILQRESPSKLCGDLCMGLTFIELGLCKRAKY